MVSEEEEARRVSKEKENKGKLKLARTELGSERVAREARLLGHERLDERTDHGAVQLEVELRNAPYRREAAFIRRVGGN